MSRIAPPQIVKSALSSWLGYHGTVTASGQAPDFGILLVLACQQFVRELHADLATHGYADIGRAYGAIFRSLADGPLTVTELAARLEITKQGAGQIVDEMSERGYLRRRADPQDGRARLVELDERGRGALAAARRFHRRYERGLARRYGAQAVAVVRAALSGMAGDEGDQGVDTRLRPLYL
jgi:DNA-binding MarR family transcriptional regulator